MQNGMLVKFARRLFGGRFVVIACAVVFLPLTTYAQGSGRQVLHGHVPVAVSRLHLQPLSKLSSAKRLNLAIGLPLRNQQALDSLLQQIYDPASPKFRQYLTPEQFTEQFGPTEEDYQKVIAFAKQNGLTVTGTSANRVLLDVSGSVADTEKAFQVTMRTYQHPTENRTFYAPDVEPSVEVDVPVVDIQGLSDFSRPHPKLHRMDAAALANAMPQNGSSPDGSGFYFGNDFRNAYAPGTTLTGAGQMVGLLEFDGFYSSDIIAYATAAGNGRANIVIQTVLLDDYNGVPTTGPNSGNSEVSLDIEMAMAMAPGLAKIAVFEAGPYGSPNDILNAMAASNTVKNLSSSWGWSGGPSTTTDNIFKNMAALGQSFFNASGDSDAFTTGASSTNGVDNTALPNAPSSSPYITQVGGTTLTMNGNGISYASETVWNWGYDSYAGGYVGSSGGISSYYSIPSWQTNVNNMAGRGGSTSFRNIPDVALTANSIFIDYGNGSSSDEYGGTSFAAPLWAGFNALVNQQAAANGKPGVGFINPAIYAIAAGSGYSSCFNDITTGNNTWPSSPNLFYATNGYDLCTGWGTPAGQSLIDALVGLTDPLGVTPSTNFSAISPLDGAFNVTSQTYLLTNWGAASLSWSLINTSSWLNASAISGTLAPNSGSSNVTISLTSATTNLGIGTYIANIWFSNVTTHVAQNRQFTLQVVPPLQITPSTGFAASGPVGGPFNVTSQSYVLTNVGITSLGWSIINTSSWLNFSPDSGAVAPGGSSTATASLTSTASNLVAGTYATTLVFTNIAVHTAQNLQFTLLTGQSVVQNGGFETGDFTDWTLVGNGRPYNLVDNGSTSGISPHSGAYFAALGQYGSIAYLSETLPTLSGQAYLLSLWMDSPDGKTLNEFNVSWNGNTLVDLVNMPKLGWTNLQFIVTASGSSTVLQIGARNDPTYLALDDVSVTTVPVPAFQTLTKTNGTLNFTWNALIGLVYQMQYKTNLLQTNWINLGAVITATNFTATSTNFIGPDPQRFYRLQLLY
jgi:subtilase family serine protease